MPRKANKQNKAAFLTKSQERYWLFCSEFKAPYIQPCASLFFHPAFKALSAATRIVYLAMCFTAGTDVTFIFPREQKAKELAMSPSTITAAIRELKKAGFIKVEQDWSHTKRQATVYQFVSVWKTNEPDRAKDGQGGEPGERPQTP